MLLLLPPFSRTCVLVPDAGVGGVLDLELSLPLSTETGCC